MRWLSEWWEAEQLAERFGASASWRRRLSSLRCAATYNLAKPLLVAAGKWRCHECQQPLPARLQHHTSCTTTTAATDA